MSPTERTPQLTNPLPLACPPHAAHSHWSCRTATARVYPFSYFIFGQHKFPEKLSLKRLSQFLPFSLHLLSPTIMCMHTLERLGLAYFSFFHNLHSFNSSPSIKKKKNNFIRHWEKKHRPLCVSMITICRALCLCLWLQHTHTHTHTHSWPDSWWAQKSPATIVLGLQAFTVNHQHSRSTDYPAPFRIVVLSLGAH